MATWGQCHRIAVPIAGRDKIGTWPRDHARHPKHAVALVLTSPDATIRVWPVTSPAWIFHVIGCRRVS
jgi:hypothetical protein